MRAVRKNYLIYLTMILVFGGLIYAAVMGGGHWLHASPLRPVAAGVDAFTQFKTVLHDNLMHPFAVLLVQIIVVLVTVRAFSFVFRWMGQPGVIGEIVAGIALGPSVLGALYPDMFGFLFRPDSLTNLELVSQLGLVLFMFVIGMEVDFGVLKNKIHETLIISHAGILVPFFLGILASFYVYGEYASHQTAFLPFALFIGISMSITAFPVLARIVQERNMTRRPVGILTIASAANDDVTAWCLLAVVIAIAKAGTLGGALYTVLLTIVYIVVMFAGVRPFLKKLGAFYSNKEVINKAFVGFVFLLLAVSAVLTEVLGIHALFGAFMAGVVMPSNPGFRKVMVEKVEDIALVFFLPLFFAFTGLRTQVGLVNTPGLWGVCLLLVLVAVIGKFGGCAVASRLVGESWKDSFIIGTLMNTRGLMELVALNIGYELGVLPPPIFVILVLMALVTTFMTTPLLNLVERRFASEARTPSAQRRLLLFFGRPETGAILLSVYKLLFGKQLSCHRVIAVHYTMGTDVNLVNAEQFRQESFIPVDERANYLGISVEKRYRVTDNLVSDMIATVEAEAPDILLLGAGPRFMADGEKSMTVFFGLFREKVDDVLFRVSCPVAIFVNRGYQDGNEVTIWINGSRDAFLFAYLERLLEEGDGLVRLYVSGRAEKDYSGQVQHFAGRYAGRFSCCPCIETEELALLPAHGLLVLSYAACEDFAARHIFTSLPSLLVIKETL
ncbi:cation:proton antiporter [Phocaeicola sp.]|uniref:cation:proton antiporter n=1 Tax=Phocaeicola sp. TaxID=2773926 RepID=UPI0023CAEA95|nr:cation:proton antiporter [Phocaeicola sp.]MDE5678668.1 cation:proton antiporter [Phocaeicola sp.]